MIKLKDLLFEGQPMTDQEKKRTISRLNKFDEEGLVKMLRTAADAANRGNARADDLAHIYRDELNRRKGVGETKNPAPSVANDPHLTSRWNRPTAEGADEGGERIDEAPSGAAIAAALDAIRSEARHKDRETQRWLHPHLRKIENALRKFNRSGS